MAKELDDYLALVAKRKAAQTTLELKMPSGAIWFYKPISIQAFAVEGRLPMHLLAKLESVKNNPGLKMSDEELMEAGVSAILICRDVMLSSLVFPRISLEPKEGCILPTQIDPEDFEFFKNFVMRGGQADANLKSQKTS